jgi:Pentapeptide repeats (8 copies)
LSASVQAWIAVVGGLATALVGILKYFNYRSRRDRLALVGESFSATVDALASQDEVRRLAAAILLRRFFDRRTEQGTAGAPYQQEAIRVIAALLRTAETGELQKLLADGLASAPDLQGADLQQCNLTNAYLGKRRGRRVNLSDADLYRADLTRASLKEATAQRTVLYEANLTKAVLEGADLTGADLRDAKLEGARFAGATIGGAKFAGASDVPPAVLELLDDEQQAPEAARVPTDSEPA